MIFLTLGTQLPFDRLTRAVDEWCEGARVGEKPVVFGQINNVAEGGYQPRNFPWVAHLDPEEFERMVGNSEFVIAHAGMGSIITSQVLAKSIVVLPRRAGFGEQRNDHQLATAEQFEGRDGIHVAWREDDLGALLDRVSKSVEGPRKSAEPFAEPALIAAVREAILEGADRNQATSRRLADRISS
jgi:UDP-N-acetylglucosamine transferase subunit ALG13